MKAILFGLLVLSASFVVNASPVLSSTPTPTPAAALPCDPRCAECVEACVDQVCSDSGKRQCFGVGSHSTEKCCYSPSNMTCYVKPDSEVEYAKKKSGRSYNGSPECKQPTKVGMQKNPLTPLLKGTFSSAKINSSALSR